MRVQPGRYWLDAAGAQASAALDAWIAAHNGKEIRVSTVEHDETIPASWYLFDVVAPVDAPMRPTKAGPNVHSRADTVQRPDPEPGFDFGILTAATAGGFAPVLLLLGLYLATKGRR